MLCVLHVYIHLIERVLHRPADSIYIAGYLSVPHLASTLLGCM